MDILILVVCSSQQEQLFCAFPAYCWSEGLDAFASGNYYYYYDYYYYILLLLLLLLLIIIIIIIIIIILPYIAESVTYCRHILFILNLFSYAVRNTFSEQ